MLKYSYRCDHCEHECTQEYERSKAPRTQVCPECNDILRRVIKLTNSADISSEDGAVDVKSKTLRRNLKERVKRLKKLATGKQEEFNKWSKNQTGGRW